MWEAKNWPRKWQWYGLDNPCHAGKAEFLIKQEAGYAFNFREILRLAYSLWVFPSPVNWDGILFAWQNN